MITIFKQRNFALLWMSGLVSLLGSWMLITTLPFYIYELTGSALATSGVLIAYMIPGILFGSVAGVFVDQWDRRKIIITANLLRAVLLLLLLVVRSPQMIWIIYLVLVIESSMGQFAIPAENALLPTLVADGQLVAANSLNALNDNLARLLGAAVGGTLLGFVGFHSVILIDSVSYLAAGLLVLLISTPAITEQPKPTSLAISTHWLRIWSEWVDGLRLVRDMPTIRNIFIVMSVAMFGDAIIGTLLVVFIQNGMQVGALEYGWILTARGLGGLIGGIIIARLGTRFGPSFLVSLGLILPGLFLLLILAFPVLPIVLILVTFIGITIMGWLVSNQTLLQIAVPDHYRGRVFGAFGTISTILGLVGAGGAGVLGDRYGTVSLLSGAAMIYIVAGLLALMLLPRSYSPLTSIRSQPQTSVD